MKTIAEIVKDRSVDQLLEYANKKASKIEENWETGETIFVFEDGSKLIANQWQETYTA